MSLILMLIPFQPRNKSKFQLESNHFIKKVTATQPRLLASFSPATSFLNI